MPRPAPTATIQLADGSSREITFDLATLEKIEDATGRTVNQILFEDLASWLQGGEGETVEQRTARLVTRVRAKFVRAFLAGVLGLPDAAAVQAAVGLDGAMAAFRAAVAAFAEAVIAFNGGDQAEAEGGAEPHPSGSGTSGPGHGSSSASQDPSSTG
ncbi:MAG: hypothetical protein L6Q35_00655 [Phycisphaerales bacterium]|nr:hypothetical protein [Phycisphaerales bacterium]